MNEPYRETPDSVSTFAVVALAVALVGSILVGVPLQLTGGPWQLWIPLWWVLALTLWLVVARRGLRDLLAGRARAGTMGADVDLAAEVTARVVSGMFYGWSAWRLQSLWFPLGCHALGNAVPTALSAAGGAALRASRRRSRCGGDLTDRIAIVDHEAGNEQAMARSEGCVGV